MECKNHPGAATGRRCVVCGEPFCDHCLVRLGGRVYCAPCKEGLVAGVGARPDEAASPRGGSRLIWVGAVLAFALVGACVVGIVLATYSARRDARAAECRMNVRRIADAIEMYRNDFEAYPAVPGADGAWDRHASLSLLVQQDYLDVTSIFQCPADQAGYPGAASPTFQLAPGTLSYSYLGEPPPALARVPLIADDAPRHENGTTVIYAVEGGGTFEADPGEPVAATLGRLLSPPPFAYQVARPRAPAALDRPPLPVEGDGAPAAGPEPAVPEGR